MQAERPWPAPTGKSGAQEAASRLYRHTKAHPDGHLQRNQAAHQGDANDHRWATWTQSLNCCQLFHECSQAVSRQIHGGWAPSLTTNGTRSHDDVRHNQSLSAELIVSCVLSPFSFSLLKFPPPSASTSTWYTAVYSCMLPIHVSVMRYDTSRGKTKWCMMSLTMMHDAITIFKLTANLGLLLLWWMWLIIMILMMVATMY